MLRDEGGEDCPAVFRGQWAIVGALRAVVYCRGTVAGGIEGKP